MFKIINGQFFTERDIFKENDVFINFMTENKLWSKKILEPFAGANNLIRFIKNINNNIYFESYDIVPQSSEVKQNDSINNWKYTDFDLVITNPPYLSKHSARRMKLNVDFKDYDDLYKLSIKKCIDNVRYTIAIIPTTLINSNRRQDKEIIKKLVIFQLLPNKFNFNDTEHPVALAFFDSNKVNDDFIIYENQQLIAEYKNLLSKQEEILKPKNKYNITFNRKNGNLCVSTSDNTTDKSNIKFLESNWINDNDVKQTNRHKVKLNIDGIKITPETILFLNKKIKELRNNYFDYLWASFKGVSKTGHFRKRLDFKTIRKIVNSAL